MDCWWPNRVRTMKIQGRPLQKNNPRHSMPNNEEPPPVLVLRPRFVGFRSSWPPRTDARKLYASRRRGTFRWVPSAPRMAGCRGGVVHSADHRPLLGPVQPSPHGRGVHRRLCTDCSEIISPQEAHSMACRWMRSRRISPVLCLDQHRGLAAGHGIQPRRQWLAGVPERWRTVLAKCHCRRHSLFWRAVYRLGRCRTHHEFAPSVDPFQTHPSRRSPCLNWCQSLRPTVGHDAARERLPRLRANHSVAKKVGQELGRGEMVLRPLPKAKSSPGGPTT